MHRLTPPVSVVPADYEYDGKTTYCYWIQQGMQVSNYDFAYVLVQGTGDECPLTITLEQTTSGTVTKSEEVEYAFTATLNLNDNVFNLTSLEYTVPDPTTGLPEQIGHSNIHTCSRSTVCDVFRTGSNRKITDQETSNFTGDSASFRQKISYDVSGEKNVFAHIILPPEDYLSESYHFITFITTDVETSTTSASSSDGSGGLSSGATIGLIVGGVVLILIVIVSIVFWRRKKNPDTETDHFRNSGFNPNSHASKVSKLDWSAEPAEYGWKDNYDPSGTGTGDHRQPPSLSASALMFNDSMNRAQKTVSSSGSIRMESPRVDAYNGYGSPSGTISTIQVPQQSGYGYGASNSRGLDQSQSSVFNDGSRVYDTESNLEYGRTPDLDTFELKPHSLESEVSMGTSYDYNGTTHMHNPAFNPLLSGYSGRESDLSSVDDYDIYDRNRSNTDGFKNAHGGGRISEASIGTVDFTSDRPQPQYGNGFSRLDESTASSNEFTSTMASSAVRSTGVYDVDDPTYQSADSFATTAASSATTNGRAVAHGTRPGRTESDGEFYEF